jgi:hypothetical protein
MQPGEELIGIYRDPSTPESIAVTTFGLYMIGSETIRLVPFRTMVRIVGTSSTDDESDLVVYTSAGETITVPIRGRRERFRDVFEFQRFLARVLEDEKRRHGPSGRVRTDRRITKG